MLSTKLNEDGTLARKRFQLILFVVLLIGFTLGFLMNQMLVQKNYTVIFPATVTPKSNSANLFGHLGESQIADALAKKIRVVCMVLTMPSNHETKAQAVRDTWASRCNAHFFISSVEDSSLPSLAGVEQESREALWDKTKFAINHAYKNYLENFDYFIKADDDTFIIVENLRKLLSEHTPDELFIMGRRFRPHVSQGYLSGGGGYVLSRAALIRIHDGLLNDTNCAGDKHGGAEDVRLGTCAAAVGVPVLDSLDASGLERFHPFTPAMMMDKKALDGTSWFASYNYHKVITGFECCSDYAVSFHYVSPSDMYVFHYFLYHLHPYGIHRDFMDVANLVCHTNST
ncbi:unnamed protein product [Dicrocoelium dendriticum]|nr:unnamed protein product [Dicrocoelium dendriticum]